MEQVPPGQAEAGLEINLGVTVLFMSLGISIVSGARIFDLPLQCTIEQACSRALVAAVLLHRSGTGFHSGGDCLISASFCF